MTDEAPVTATRLRHVIAAEVRAELGRQNKTHREVGEILGLPQSSTTLRINGERSFRAEEILKLADALSVPVDRFLMTPVVGAS